MTTPSTLTVLSYNVRSLRDDPAAVARVIRGAGADVVILQETPRFLRWRSTCAALARRSGMTQVSGGRPAGSNLILSTLGVRVITTYDLSFSRRPNLHDRGAALAVLELGGSPFAIAGTHLDLTEEPRLTHLDELAALAADRVPADAPLIVGGDLNAVPGSNTWSRLERFGPDSYTAANSDHVDDDSPAAERGFTYSAATPVRRIDGLFADARLRPVRAEVIDSADVRIGSDHRPLLVEYEFQPEARLTGVTV